MVRTHIFRKTRPNGPSDTLSSMQLQVMLSKLSYFSKLESSSVVVFWKYFWRIFEIISEIFKCFSDFLKFWIFSESFRVYKFFRKWCSMCCSAPMTDVSLSRALLFIPLIRTLIRLASWHIFERYFFFPLCEFLSRFIKFLELFFRTLNFGKSRNRNLCQYKTSGQIITWRRVFLSGCRTWMGESTHTAWSARRRYPQWGSAPRHEDPNTINTKLA